MFENIGEKIKGLAKNIWWTGCAATVVGVILFLSLMAEADGLLIGLAVLVGGIMMCVNSLLIYGFGELVENSSYLPAIVAKKRNEPTAVVGNQTPIAPAAPATPVAPAAPAAPVVQRTRDDDWVCKKCGTKNSNATVCSNCWEMKS